MAAIMGSPRRRKGPAALPINVKVEDGGRRYRVCYIEGSLRVMLVALKCPGGGERLLEPTGRRARQIIRKTGLALRV